LFVSADADVEIYAYDANLLFLRARQGEDGLVLAQRVLASIHTKGAS
jgi:hypothetical protein